MGVARWRLDVTRCGVDYIARVHKTRSLMSGRFETETSYDERYFEVASNVNYAQTRTSNSLTFELRNSRKNLIAPCGCGEFSALEILASVAVLPLPYPRDISDCFRSRDALHKHAPRPRPVTLRVDRALKRRTFAHPPSSGPSRSMHALTTSATAAANASATTAGALANSRGSARVARMPRRVDAPVCRCLLYTSPSPRDVEESRMPSSA